MASSRFSSPISQHLALLFVSILCGTGVWLVFQLTETSEITLNVPVRYVNIAEEVEVLSVTPETVPVKFTFPATELSRMVPNNFWVEVDFSGLKERIGRNLEDRGERRLSRERIQTNIQRADSLNIEPLELLTNEISWEARLRWTRGVIAPNITGKPAPGHLLDMSRVAIEGDEELRVLLTQAKERELETLGIDNVTISTEEISIEGASGFVQKEVDLILPKDVSYLPGEKQSSRKVMIDIIEESITRVIEDVPISYQFIFSGEGLQATVMPPTVDVTITGRLTAVNALTKDDIKFNLFGVSENPGERRQVAVETRIDDTEIRSRISSIETNPRTVIVSIEAVGEAGIPPTPRPSPTPTPVQNEVRTYEIIVEGGLAEDKESFKSMLEDLAPVFTMTDSRLTDNQSAFRISSAQSIQDLLTIIVEESQEFPFAVSYDEQRDSSLRLTIQEREVVPESDGLTTEVKDEDSVSSPTLRKSEEPLTVTEDSPTT